MAGLRPMRGYLTRTFSRSWTFSSSSRFWRRAFWTVRTTFSSDRGFSRKSKAPSWVALTAVSIVP